MEELVLADVPIQGGQHLLLDGLHHVVQYAVGRGGEIHLVYLAAGGVPGFQRGRSQFGVAVDKAVFVDELAG